MRRLVNPPVTPFGCWISIPSVANASRDVDILVAVFAGQQDGQHGAFSQMLRPYGVMSFMIGNLLSRDCL